MSEYLIQGETLTSLADEIRVLSGSEGTMGLDAMKSNVNTANSAVSAALSALVDKGVDVPDGSNVSGLAELIGMIEAGGAKIASGTFVPNEDIRSFSISHNLGVIPTFAVWVLSDPSSEGFLKNDALLGVAFKDITTQAMLSANANYEYNYTESLNGRFHTYNTITYGIAANNYSFAKATATTIVANTNNVGGYFRAGKTYYYIIIG